MSGDFVVSGRVFLIRLHIGCTRPTPKVCQAITFRANRIVHTKVQWPISEKLANFGAWAVMGAMAIGMYVVPDWGFLKSEITSYSADCVVPVVNGRCPKDLFANTPVTYKVSTSDQSVIYWVNGFPPSRLANCAVASRTSWKCEYPDKSATM